MKSTDAQKLWKKKNHVKLRKYFRDRKKAIRLSYRVIIQDAKNKPCADCHQMFHYCVMDFDHLDSKLKKFDVSDIQDCPSEARLLEEIAKCEVVCSNCHRIRTFNRKFNLAVVEQADTPHLKRGGFGHIGSIPICETNSPLV